MSSSSRTMFTPTEIRIMISTLSGRRSWLRKNLDNAELDTSQRDEYLEACKLIDSSMKKLARMAESSSSKGILTGGNPAQDKPTVLKVLVAEDNEESAKLLVELLNDMGIHEVEIATDGIDAFDKIKAANDPWPLILCDWNLPGLTGLEIYQKAKASNTLRGAHFMMVTAVTEAARIREAIQVGINDYIVKPIDMEILEGKVRSALGDLLPQKEKKTG